MKAVGIIAEYNPLHNGHIYHMNMARKLSGADAVVVAMSGNYVQRGEPAIFDKWTRTEHALAGGADLVVEIPVLFCLGDAGKYASAGVSLLESTGAVSHVAFGSECGDTDFLVSIADDFNNNADEIASEILSLRSLGLSYPAARERAFVNVISEIRGTEPDHDPYIQKAGKLFNSSNDILALEYVMSLRKAKPLAVKRAGAGYDDPYDIKFEYQSASAVRKQFFDGRDMKKYVPECTWKDLRSKHTTGTGIDKWFDTLRYAVLSTPEEVIEDCPSGGEGLANLMKKEIKNAKDWESFAQRVHSKRYTYSRISRLCMQVLLGITRSKYPVDSPGYIRVLGFNEKGRQLLAEIRSGQTSELPLITNINKESDKPDPAAKSLLELDKYASDIYNLMCGRDLLAESDAVHRPVMFMPE